MANFTTDQLVDMSRLFNSDADHTAELAVNLDDAALALGLYARARTTGFTMEQWTIIRSPQATAIAAVLSLDS